MRGRKPKPTALRVLEGNPGKRQLNDREPHFREPVTAPYAPRYLNRPAQEEWRRLVRLLMQAGLYTEVDRAALALYCQAWGRWVLAEEAVLEDGEVLETDKGFRYQNPWRYEANRAWEQARKMLAEFGMTPSSRSRIKVGLPDNEQTFADQLAMWVEAALHESG